MRSPNSGITPEGLPCAGLLAFSALVFALLHWKIAACLCLALVWFTVHFFRDPERVVPQAKGLATSPADGKIVRIETRPDPFTDAPRTCVSIFMNVFSVHVNRAPVTGTMTDIVYWPGKFLNASLDKASKDNERCAYHLRDEEGGAWTMVQIAGLIARRIVCRVEVNDALARGERFGMIRFGSRVDLYLPDSYIPTVGQGDQVFAGQSIIARTTASEHYGKETTA